MKYYTAMKINKLELLPTSWIRFKNIILSKSSKCKKKTPKNHIHTKKTTEYDSLHVKFKSQDYGHFCRNKGVLILKTHGGEKLFLWSS